MRAIQLGVCFCFLLLVGTVEAFAVEALGGEMPVYEMIEHGFHELGPFVAIVDVISMFPHIEGEQGADPVRPDPGRGAGP